jgi:K+-transporting ATPase ATPase B chain
MIGLVEGAKRQKTPNEIADDSSARYDHLLVVLISLRRSGYFAGLISRSPVLVACSFASSTTIGGLLSAIGIAGIDRLVQRTCSR